MALILLQIQDQPDGSATVQMVVEPRVQEGKPATTQAEQLALVALNAVDHAINTARTEKPGPKLVVVGSDELPR